MSSDSHCLIKRITRTAASIVVLAFGWRLYQEHNKYKKKHIINTNNAPAAIGPYSQAVIHNNMIYVSGCIAIPPNSSTLCSDEIIDQTRQALENLKHILIAAGSDCSKVVKTTVLLANMDDYTTVNEIYAEYFPPDSQPPARAAFAVKTLPKNALIEIDAIAIL